MRFFLLIIIIMSSITTKAQLAKGNYSYVNKAPAKAQGISHSVIIEYEHCRSLPRKLFIDYFCAMLDVFDNNKIYLHLENSFDSGNTNSINSGDYSVDLISTGKNTYSGKNKLIDLTLEITENNELKIVVHNRVENINSRGIINRKENRASSERQEYFFKQRSDTPQNLITELAMMPIEALGINYGAYKVMTDYVAWEDITKWGSKEEVRRVDNADMATFEVYTHNYNNYNYFYLIHSNSHQTFPAGYTDYAKDKNYGYYQGTVIKGVKPDDFKVVDPLHAKTSKKVFYKNKLIRNADADTFESINGGYTMDKNNYYDKGQLVKKNETIKKLLKDKDKIKIPLSTSQITN